MSKTRTPKAVPKDFVADLGIHPGEFLAEELEARGMSQRELAAKMGRPIQVINAICTAKKSITADTALGLEKALGISAVFWLNLEMQFQLAKARKKERHSAA
jgi:HTH-type transcriptional regulator/antitoxin HigA